MFKAFFSFFLFTSFLLAYVDSDMDGVPDENDRCTNTPLTELVDLSGCTIKKLISEHNFDLVLGQSYVEDSISTLSLSTIKMDYYYKNWSMQLATSYYKSSLDIVNSSGQNDTYLSLFYLFNPLDNFFLTLGGGIVFPTYDVVDNNMDYTASLYARYKIEKWSLIMGTGYNKIGDIDSSNNLNYNNKLSYNLGVGYAWDNKFYSSLGYSRSNSAITTIEDLETLSLYGYYPMDKHWFASVNYGYGLSAINKRENIGVSLGYFW
ncbi:MAG: Unknown protein [uncultured Sulfurovum sp.]|uniref:Uncharacterized protein n=1 Tax=uncultured Sulfurovum sp. TaxID=269237 RepID=A0A6S6SBY3_9BACT|nr:MAG: Unknown protein [uncultured Sulfurovum sp.]